jgi:uncharacterized protein YycO
MMDLPRSQISNKFPSRIIRAAFCILMILVVPCFALYTDGVNMPHRITTYNPDRGPVVVAGAQFFTGVTVEVNGVPVQVDIPGSKQADQTIKISVFPDDVTRNVRYQFDRLTERIVMHDPSGTRTYDYGDGDHRDIYFAALNMIQKLEKLAYIELGLDYDPESNELSVDRLKYLSELEISSDYGIVTSTSGDVLTVSVAKGMDLVSFQYNAGTGMFSVSEDIMFADGYILDAIDGAGLYAINDPYPSVAASGVGAPEQRFMKDSSSIFSLMIDHCFSSAAIREQTRKVVSAQYRLLVSTQNVVKHPMQRPMEPDITDMDWVDKESGIVRIKGTADRDDKHNMKIYLTTPIGETIVLTDDVIWVGDNWEVINISNECAKGHNKVNVIISRPNGCEVESGDASIYLGDAGEPDLILVSPRDRRVYGSEEIPSLSIMSIRVKGRTNPGSTIAISNNSIVVDTSGSFNIPNWQITNFREGANEINILISTPNVVVIPKSIIGSYLFNVKRNSIRYILRHGDFLFNGTSPYEEGFWLLMGHPALPFDPDHSGMYTGNGKVTESKHPEVITRDISNWNNDDFYYATQVPKLVSEENRIKVCDRMRSKVGKSYKWPMRFEEQYGLPGVLTGWYTPEMDRFYCSEVAFWSWERTAVEAGFDFGINRSDLFFPVRYTGIDSYNSVLPAYLCEKSMEAGRVNK